ncbi:MAG TPA: hypothetical protein VFP84_26235, partial [Kofleriaceae bacterium]|nr:hypothetical protein [Kofleriaceae bacterium]
DDGLAHVEPGSASRRAALAVCGLLPERAGPQRAAIAAIAAIADDGHEDPAARFTAAAALLAQGDHR